MGNHDYEEEDPDVFAISDNGWTKDNIGFLWLKDHFEVVTLPSDAHEAASRARGESRIVGECGRLARRREWRRGA
jgi:hypothetical protein